MAYSNELENVTKEANADLSGFKFRVVELLSTNKVALAALDQAYGILQNAPRSGEAATVAVGGFSKAIAAVAVTIGQKVKATSGGWCTPVTSGAAHTAFSNLVGRVHTDAASGQLFTVEINRQTLAVASGAAIV